MTSPSNPPSAIDFRPLMVVGNYMGNANTPPDEVYVGITDKGDMMAVRKTAANTMHSMTPQPFTVESVLKAAAQVLMGNQTYITHPRMMMTLAVGLLDIYAIKMQMEAANEQASQQEERNTSMKDGTQNNDT